MPKTWRLTRQAETALVEIAHWTLKTFGPRQAAAYEEDLIARCAEIASGEAWSEDCRRLIDPDLPEHRRLARAGQHFIVFVESAESLIITDFLHARSDLARRLAPLAARRPDRS